MNIPCEECITFAICNIQIKDMSIPDVTQFSMMKHCGSLQDYIKLSSKDMDHAVVNRREISKARTLFNLSPANQEHFKGKVNEDTLWGNNER